MNSKSLTESTFINPEFEQLFKKMQDDEIITAEITGKQDGRLNKPQSRQHYNVQFRTHIRSTIQKALDYNFSIYRPNSSVAAVKELRSAAEKKLAESEKKINAVEKTILFLKRDLTNLSINWFVAFVKVFTPILIGLSEGGLLLTLMSSGGYGMLMKFSLSLLIALCTAIGLHTGAGYIMEAQSPQDRKKRTVIVLSIAGVVAMALGVWRALITTETATINGLVNLNHSGNNQSFAMTVFPFIAVSFVSFLAGLALEQKFAVNKQEQERIKKYREKKTELAEAEKEYKALIKEKKDTEDHVREESANVLSQQESAHANECRLLSLAEQIRSTYEAANVEHRPDNICPDYFGESMQQEFTLHFNHLFPNQNK
ncbi:MAG: hypothetical protein JST86_09475 [Bacteroidetes bacterium]|nr:hypothetical protein [Bacteroidota bacterium]